MARPTSVVLPSGSCPLHEAMAPMAPRATPSRTSPVSWRRRPATASTTAAITPVSTAARRGCSPARPRRSKVPAPLNARSSTKVSSGATPARAAQPVARRVAAPGEGGGGEPGQHQRGGERGGGADPAGQRDHRHREGRAQHHGALGDRRPAERHGGDEALGEQQGGPVEVGVHADGGHVDRHEERAEVEQGAGGGGEGGLEAAAGDQEAAGGEEEDPELHGVGDGAPVHGHEHGGGGEEQEGAGAGHPDGAGAGGVGTGGIGTGRSAGSSHGATVRRSGPLGDPADPLGGPGGSPIRCRAPGRSGRAPASG